MQVQVLIEYPKFRKVWIAQVINVLGNSMFSVAVALFLLHRSDSAKAIGAVLAMYAFGGTASVLAAGVLVDRIRCSRVMIASDALGMIGLLLIFAIGATGSIFMLVLGALIMGLGSGFYRPSYGALLPHLVSDSSLRPANALRSQANRLSAIIGASFGGWICALSDPKIAFLFDFITFAISIIYFLNLNDPHPTELIDEGDSSYISDFFMACAM